MSNHCEICGNELNYEEEEKGICEKCKKSTDSDQEYDKDEEFDDPAVT